MALSLREIAIRLEGVQWRGGHSFQCKCPCHNDRKPSLTVSDGDEPGKIVFHCHTGVCTTRDILQELGLTWADIGEEQEPITWQTTLSEFIGLQFVYAYHYRNERGAYLYSKIRFCEPDGSKTIRYGVLDQQKCIMRIKSGLVKKDDHVLYNLPKTIETIKAGYPIYFVEGEKDVETLRRLGITATTCGGSGDWRAEFAPYFTGARVVILQDNDEAGEKLTRNIAQGIRHYAHAHKVIIPSRKEHGDVTDYIEAGNSVEDLKELVEGEPYTLAPWLHMGGTESKPKTLINEDLLAESLLKTMNYIILRERDSQREEVYIYDHGVYRQHSKNELKAIARQRVPFGIGKDDVFNKAANLLMYSGRNIHRLGEINDNEWNINVKNGLYDVKEKRLLPHDPKVLSTIQLNCSYPDLIHEPKIFMKFMREFCDDGEGNIDQEMMDLLQEWMGAAISNLKMWRLKVALILCSLLGNTGKSVLLKIITSLVGEENVINVPLQKMSDRFVLGDIYGKRLISSGDQTAADIEDSSVFKQLTGGDEVRVEMKGKMSFSFVFNGAIQIACNDLPSFKDDKGNHVFDRLLLVPCRNHIPKEQQDKALIDKILEERDQIFRWALEGLHRLIDNGFKFTRMSASEEPMEEFRSRNDSLRAFLYDKCVITGDYRKDRIRKTDFENSYTSYCLLNDFTPLHKKNIPARAEKNGLQYGKVGELCYKGVRWKGLL